MGWGAELEPVLHHHCNNWFCVFFRLAPVWGIGERGCTEQQLADEGTGTVGKRGGGQLANGWGSNWAVFHMPL